MVDKQPLFSQLPAAQQELALQRFQIIQPFLEGRVLLTYIVRTHRLALRTARRWVQRYRADGLAGLVRSVRADRGTRRGMSLEMQQFIQDTESYEVQFLSKFTEAELEYLQSQRLGRLATVNQRGEPQVAAVGFRYNYH